MFQIISLSDEDIKKVLDMETVIRKVEKAYLLKHQKNANLWPMIFHEFQNGNSDMDIKSGYIIDEKIYGLKVVSWFKNNKNKNLPQLIGTIILFDATTGAPKAILSAEHITSMRTGAAGAIGVKYLAKENSDTLLIVGTGNQAFFQIQATLLVKPSIKKIYLYNSINKEGAIDLKLKLNNMYDIEIEVVDDIQKATSESDIIITTTPSKKAIIKSEWVKPGTHFSCIGSDMEGKQEIDENLFKNARIFTDDITQSISIGEAEKAIKRGIIRKENIVSEIGAVISGEVNGRISDLDITIYDSTGIALQDLITAEYAILKANENKVGNIVSL